MRPDHQNLKSRLWGCEERAMHERSPELKVPSTHMNLGRSTLIALSRGFDGVGSILAGDTCQFDIP